MSLLLKTQANWLFKELSDSKIGGKFTHFKHAQYELKIASRDRKNQFFFMVKFYIDGKGSDTFDYAVSFSPGIQYVHESHFVKGWNGLKKQFKDWLSYATRELESPDLWAEATRTAQLFAPTAEPSDDKFTRTELAEVQGQLRLLQLSFTSAALPEAAKKKLIELTETAAVKAEGLTKKDWQNWIIGGFISAITALALNPTQAGEVLKLVKAAFGGLFLH